MNQQKIDSIIQALWSPQPNGGTPVRVYAILDGARDRRIYPLVHSSGLEHSCLYTGIKTYALARAAPYVVALRPDAELLHKILDMGWGNCFGVYAVTYQSSATDAIRKNCRRIAKVEGPNGKNLVFRYYDPRVLRVVMPTFELQDYALLFRDVDAYLCENEQGNGLKRYAFNRETKTLQCDEIRLNEDSTMVVAR